MLNQAQIEKIRLYTTEAGNMAYLRQGQVSSMIEKKTTDVVPNLATNIDVEVENYLIERFADLLPTAGFYAEETASSQPDHDHYFVIDPIDGTNNFINGLPAYCVNVGFVHEKQMILSCTFHPHTGRFYFAHHQHGATCNNTKIAVAQRSARMRVMGLGIQPRNWPKPLRDAMFKLCSGVRSVRIAGSIALELAWLASGNLDLWLGGGRPWDVWPGKLLIEEAGGVVANIDGSPIESCPSGLWTAGSQEAVDWLCQQVAELI